MTNTTEQPTMEQHYKQLHTEHQVAQRINQKLKTRIGDLEGVLADKDVALEINQQTLQQLSNEIKRLRGELEKAQQSQVEVIPAKPKNAKAE
jgi:chromosome segregation ATPase